MLQSLLLEISKQVELVHEAENIQSFVDPWNNPTKYTFDIFLPWVWRFCPLSLRFCLCCLLHPTKARVLQCDNKLGENSIKWQQCNWNLCRARRARLSVLLLLRPRSCLSLRWGRSWMFHQFIVFVSTQQQILRREQLKPETQSWRRPSQRSFPCVAPEHTMMIHF